MNAYVKFKPYDKDFYTDAFAKAIKGDGTADFESVLRRTGGKPQGGKLKKTLEDGKAMYLYGGRQALISEFTAFRNNVGDFVLTPATGKYLSVYHGKVDASGKTKRILMITCFSTTGYPPSAISDRRLKVNLGDSYQTPAPGRGNWGFYNMLDLRGLDQIVRAIPD